MSAFGVLGLPLPRLRLSVGAERCQKDGFANHIRPLQDIIIPEPQDAVAFTFQKGIPLYICVRFSMLAAVGFDDEAMLDTQKVGDVRAYGNLPAELHPTQCAIPQTMPEQRLGLRSLATQPPGDSGLLAFPHD